MIGHTQLATQHKIEPKHPPLVILDESLFESIQSSLMMLSRLAICIKFLIVETWKSKYYCTSFCTSCQCLFEIFDCGQRSVIFDLLK